MITIGIASLASVLLFSSIAPAAGMSVAMASNLSANQSAYSAAQQAADYMIDDIDAPVDAGVKRERAIELASQYVQIPTGYQPLSTSYQAKYDNYSGTRGSWYISFTKENQQGFYGDIHVMIDADSGELISYSITEIDPARHFTFPPKVNVERAKQLALDYISLMSPGETQQLIYDNEYESTYLRPLAGEIEYPFIYSQVVNGIVVPSNYFMVSVNGDGQIRSYTKHWNSNIKFETPVNPLSPDQAAEQFHKLTDIKLQYLLPDASNLKAAPAIAYTMDSILLDAETGEALSLSGLKRDIQSKPVPVSEKPMAEAAMSTLNLTKEQAVSRVSAMVPLPAAAKLHEASYHEITDPLTGVTSYQWELAWTVESDQQEEPSIYAVVNSVTGAILQYNRYEYTNIDGEAAKHNPSMLSHEELKLKALEAVKNLLPAYAHQLYLQPQVMEAPIDGVMPVDYSDFYFNRIIDGVYSYADSVSLHLNAHTGAIENFNSHLLDSLYPAEPPQVINIEQAKELLLSQYRFEQQYIVVDPGAIGADELSPDKQTATKLVYNAKPIVQFREPAFLDATTGLWKDNETNTVVQPYMLDPEDIKGHPAEEALKWMLEYEVLDVVDGKINPDQIITRGQFIKMLVVAINGGYFPLVSDFENRAATFSDVSKDSAFFPYVETALDYNLIGRASDQFEPESQLNRTETADLIVRALGYQKLAEIEGLFNNKAIDIDQLPNQGAIAIVNALQIMSLEGEAFSPYEPVTRAQAATTIFNFLKAISQLKDTSANK